MAELLTLDQFHATQRQYHIYRIQNSKVAHHPHYHDYFQVCFVTRGEILHGEGNREVTLGPGDAFIIPPGFTHSIRFHNAYSEMYSLSFVPGVGGSEFFKPNIRSFLDALQTGSAVCLRVMPDQDRRKMLQSLLDCLILQQQSDCPPELSPAASMITAVLYLLAQSYYAQPKNAEAKDALVYSSALVQCIQYIDRHFREKLTLEGLSHQFGLSRSTFCTVFPQFAGVSPGRYIAQRRIQEAQLLIRSQGGLTVSQIGRMVGYDDNTTFYRNFMQVTGMSPGKYRKLYRADPEDQGGTQ